MLLQVFCHPCYLVTLLPGRIFFCWNCHLRSFCWLNQVVRDLRDFLSFFLVHPYKLAGGITLSPVNPLDYGKTIAKFKMEITPKNLTRLQGNKGDE